ncbi:MAG: sel1 repeat family protein, partial [Rhizobiaceae bacterium]|nr:sel1 repeat family protein [Rhizobiaceae bacterium]
MKLREIALGLTLALSFAFNAYADDDGQSAYDRGDYAAALAYWQPMARQGDATAQDGLGSLY